jgi:hypothetical protein
LLMHSTPRDELDAATHSLCDARHMSLDGM